MVRIAASGGDADEFDAAMSAMSSNDENFDEACIYDLQEGDAERIAASLARNTTIIKLDLGSSEIDDDGVALISNALRTNFTLRELNLDMNEISHVALASITSALRENYTLEKLSLDRECEHEASEKMMNADVAAGIIEDLGVNNTLKHLSLQSFLTKMHGESGSIDLVNGIIRKNTGITHLDVGLNGFDKDDLEGIARSLCHNNSITKITLSNNNFSAEAIRNVSGILKRSGYLRSLDFSSAINQEDKSHQAGNIVAVASILVDNKFITDIDFEENFIDDSGRQFLNRCIEENRSFLMDSILSSLKGEVLSFMQEKTILVHLNDDNTIIKECFRFATRSMTADNNQLLSAEQIDHSYENWRKMFTNKFKENVMRASFVSDRLVEDLATNIGGFMAFSTLSDIRRVTAAHTFNKSVDDVSNEMAYNCDLILRNSGKIRKLIAPSKGFSSSAFNANFIWESLENGMPIDSITRSLSRINDIPDLVQLSQNNPKAVGFLVTLDRSGLDTVIDMLKSPVFKDITISNLTSNQMSDLINVSKDKEKLEAAARVIQERPGLLEGNSSFKEILLVAEGKSQSAAVDASKVSSQAPVENINDFHSEGSDAEDGFYTQRLRNERKRGASLDIEGDDSKKQRGV